MSGNKAQLAVALRKTADAFKGWETVLHTPMKLSRDPRLMTKGEIQAEAERVLRRACALAMNTAADHLTELRDAVHQWGLHPDFAGVGDRRGDVIAEIAGIAATRDAEDPGIKWFAFECWVRRDSRGKRTIADELDRLAKRAEDEANPVLADLRQAINTLRQKHKCEPQVDDVLRLAGGTRQKNLAGLRVLQERGEYKGHAKKIKPKRSH